MRIFLLLTLFLFSIPIRAARWAEVGSNKALVYADRSLDSPIGFVRRGKRVRVGEVVRKDGQSIPVIVSGKLTYMKVNDLIIEGKINAKHSRITENSLDHSTDLITEDFTQNNFMTLSGEIASAGTQWDSYSNADNDTSESLLGFRLGFEHRFKTKKYYVGFGFGQQLIEQERNSVSIITLDFKVSIVPVKTAFFSLDLFFGPYFAPKITIENVDTTDDKKAYAIGYQAGGQISFFPTAKMGFIGGVSYKNLYVSDLKDIQIEGEKEGDLTLGGLGFFAGLHYRFR